jgi:hypothetical protein
MKPVFLPLFLGILFSSVKLYSQIGPYSVSASFGPSFPVGRFERAGIDTISKKSAAEPGIAGTVGLTCQFKGSRFGASLVGGWQQHRVDGPAIAKTLEPQYPGSEVYAGSLSWHIWKLLIGPTYKIPVVKSGTINFQCGAAGGLMNTTLPDTWMSEFDSAQRTASSSASFTHKKLASFCYQVNAGINVWVSKVLSIHGDLIYFHADPKNAEIIFTGSQGVYLGGNPVNEEKKITVDYPVSTLDFIIGIRYYFK